VVTRLVAQGLSLRWAIYVHQLCKRRMRIMNGQTEPQEYHGYRRCSRIDYGNTQNAFAITICVKPRRSAFVSAERNEALVAEMKRLQDDGAWGVYLYCVMPDHIHLIVNPGTNGLSHAVRLFKGRIAAWWRQNGDGSPLWQASYFDHRIRSSESFMEKCEYALQNPVRAGLVARPEDYPWSGSFAQR
jgi:putative transposase